jgi:hypothetical protein
MKRWVALAFVYLFLSTHSARSQSIDIFVPDGTHTIVCENGEQPILDDVNDTATCTPVVTDEFVETFDGLPSEPTAWSSPNWDIAVHSRDIGTWVQLDSMMAQHGIDCSPYPATHFHNNYDTAVFQCNNHMMTSLKASGYGAISLTPNRLVDFSNGVAIIRFDVSTLRTSNRDWWDVWLSPYECNLVVPLEDWLPDLNGEPCQAVHIRMKFGSSSSPLGVFEGFVINDFEDTPIPQKRTTPYDSFFVPSATGRETFELHISTNYVKFGMPEYDLWWIDTNIPELSWDRAVVQILHHSYNPLKSCFACSANTYHWDNVSITPSIPFTMLQANQRFVDPTSNQPVAFLSPSPVNSCLRFSGIGDNLEFSIDNGATWQAAIMQAQEEYHGDHFRTYWTPIPSGVQTIMFRGQNWYGGRWQIRSMSIWSLENQC